MRQVFADYFTNFQTRETTGRSESWRYYCGENAQWSGDLYTQPSAHHKQIASVYNPLIGPYDTLDPDVLEYHILLAKLAGIDGFLCEYDIAYGHNSQVPVIMARLAKKYKFQVGVNWVTLNFTNHMPKLNDRVEMLNAAKDCLHNIMRNIYDIAGAGIDNRPLLLFYGIRAADYLPTIVKDTIFSADELQALRASIQTYNPIFLTPHFQPELFESVDGFFPWVLPYGSEVPAGSLYDKIGNLYAQHKHLHHFYSHVETALQENKITHFLAGVWPGFDDHRGRAGGEDLARYVPRENGKTLDLTWEMALASKADTILHITWNNWVESTIIEPSLEFGYQELETTQKQISLWKNIALASESLRLPEQLLRLRRKNRELSCLGFNKAKFEHYQAQADKIALLLAQGHWQKAAAYLDQIHSQLEHYYQPRIRMQTRRYRWQSQKEPSDFLVVTKNNTTENPPPYVAQSLTPFIRKFILQLTPPHTLEPATRISSGKLKLTYLDTKSNFLRISQGTSTDFAPSLEIAHFRKQALDALETIELDIVPGIFPHTTEEKFFIQIETDQPTGTEWMHSLELNLKIFSTTA
ncbi:glycoside hydrolase family 99-like domain-containing protein [bacterium]|nr:glycoside hydrolase family 99-like domain-containing protein [bacterium]